MDAGKLRSRICIERRDATQTNTGGDTGAYVLVVDVWACVQPVSGTESFAAAQRNPELTHVITTRFRPNISGSNMRLRMGARIFEITAPPQDLNERHEWLEFACIEVTG